MRVAALYDIHGNLPALEAVMAEVRKVGVDRVVVGGDVVNGPMPIDVLAYLLSLDIPTQFIQGNADTEILAKAMGIETGNVPERYRPMINWVAGQLSPEDIKAIESWPLTTSVTVDGIGEVLFCHATPRNNTEVFSKLTAEEKLIPVFAGVTAPLVMCGHTHMQFDRMVGKTRVVNSGSVGMPFGYTGAFWTLLGPDVQHQRTAYDLEAAADLVRKTAHPTAEEFAATGILNPPSEADVHEMFSRDELS